MACPRVLITGFGPFPGAAENSSAWLAEALAAAGAPSGCTLHTEVLPTEWTEVATLGPRLLQQHRPRLILHLGLSRNAKGFRIERSAHNVIDFREDARGAMPEKRNVLALWRCSSRHGHLHRQARQAFADARPAGERLAFGRGLSLQLSLLSLASLGESAASTMRRYVRAYPARAPRRRPVERSGFVARCRT